MKKLTYMTLGLMGIMGTLSVGVVNAAAPEIQHYDSNISYTLNSGFSTAEEFTAGTITISDGSILITILDRNLGANKAGTGCRDASRDGLCIQLDDTYGYHFQWGNNYGFKPCTGDNCKTLPNGESSNTQVVATSITYNPSQQQYYSNNTFIKGNTNWLDDNIGDLWGGDTTSPTDGGGGININDESYVLGNDWKVTNAEERQGPCPEGFHVPSIGELTKIESMLGNLSMDFHESNNGLEVADELLLPFPGLRSFETAGFTYQTRPSRGYLAHLWSSSPSSTNKHSYYLQFNSDGLIKKSENGRAYAQSIRCFYNEYNEYIPSLQVIFLDDGIEIASGTVKEGEKRTDTIPTPNEREGYRFDYWYADGTNSEFDFSIPIEEDTILHAHRTLTARIPNGIYTGFNESSDITVIWDDETLGDIHLTLARNSLPGYYYWGWNEPANNNWSSYPTNGAEYNNNWGGGGDNIDNSYDDGNERYKRQGPCPDGFHIPSKRELNALAVAWCNIYEDCYPRYEDTQIEGITGDFRKASDWTESNKMIWMNKAGLGIAFRDVFNMGSDTDFRSSSPNINDTSRAYSIYVPNWRVAPSGNGSRNMQYRIRCFKNYVTIPEPPLIEISTIYITGITLPVGGEIPTTEGIASLTEGITVVESNTGGTIHRQNRTDGEPVFGTFIQGEEYVISIPFTVSNGYKLSDSDYSANFSGYEGRRRSNSNILTFIFKASSSSNHDVTVSHHTDSNISYTLNGNELFTGVGTITVTDGNNTFTMLDRNLGATIAGTGCEDPSWGEDESTLCSSDDTYGYYFQWGNNYGFHGTNILSGTEKASWDPKYSNKGYYGDIFIKADSIPYDYWIDSEANSSNHSDLWGGSNDYNNSEFGFGINNKNRRGPCPEGFHIPSLGEWNKLINMLTGTSKQKVSRLHNNLLLPFGGFYSGDDGKLYYIGNVATARSSSPLSAKSLGVGLRIDEGFSLGEGYRTFATAIRCLYDSYDTYHQPSNKDGQTGGYSGGGSNSTYTVDEDSPNGSQDDNQNINSSHGSAEGQEYSDEFQNAYKFAYKNGITTMDTIEKADMEGPLTRIAMAKMLSQYAINVLNKKPANITVPNFKDITSELDEQYDFGITLAYQLGIMGINMPNNKFRPNDLVTRGEFATALSRMLFGTPDGEYEDTDIYYTNHLKKLTEEKIITNNNPSLQELRGYVMIMLMRSSM